MKAFKNTNRRMISWLLLAVIIPWVTGCNYYGIRISHSTPDQEVIELYGNPELAIPKLKQGTPVIASLKDGGQVQKYFIKYDSTFVYLGASRRKHDQQLRLKDLQSIHKTSTAKYFIVHQQYDAWHLSNFQVNDQTDAITGKLEPLPRSHQLYLVSHPRPGKAKMYEKWGNERYQPTNEVHLFTSPLTINKDSTVTIPLTAIKKVEVYEDRPGPKRAAIISMVIITAAAVILIANAGYPSKPSQPAYSPKPRTSCPFVYIGQNDSRFVGEIYGGAIVPSLERDDYLPLPYAQSDSDTLVIRVSNELQEVQHTNLAELVAVDLPVNTRALLDKQGKVHTFGTPVSPGSARTSQGRNMLAKVLTKDSVHYRFDHIIKDHNEQSSLTLSFAKPAAVKNGKLILSARNSQWLDLMYAKFTQKFGTAYSQFVAMQKSMSRETLLQWSMDEHIPLSVKVESDEGWQAADYFETVGPMAARDVIMPIDLSKVSGDSVRIRLETGFRFWEVDYAAMDFSVDLAVEPKIIQASGATDENGKPVHELIAQADHQYLTQPEIGNVATLAFHVPAHTGRILFLHSRGYYEHIRNYKDTPSWTAISGFWKSGAFARFAREQYDSYAAGNDLVIIVDDGVQ